jgi:hypothetical protein
MISSKTDRRTFSPRPPDREHPDEQECSGYLAVAVLQEMDRLGTAPQQTLLSPLRQKPIRTSYMRPMT